jgi:hypothetical protein
MALLNSGDFSSFFKDETPNDETLQAIAEGEKMLKNPYDYKLYSSFDEILEDVLNV